MKMKTTKALHTDWRNAIS